MDDLIQQDVYLDDPREEFADFIPSSARRAVDIGCGKGGFGRTLRERLGQGAWIGGIESVDAQAHAARAGHGFDEVVSGYYPEAMPESWSNLDLMCFMDVLEHLYDPWAVLDACHDALAPDGRVLASIPNIQYFPVLLDALRGRWDYEDTGTLDRTHVRFFTRRSIVEMFHRAGFEVERIEGVNDVLSQFRYRHLRAAADLFGDARYLHMSVVARRMSRPEGPVSILAARELTTAEDDLVSSITARSRREQRRRDSPVTVIRQRGRHLAAVEVKFWLSRPTEAIADYGTWRRRVAGADPLPSGTSQAYKTHSPLAVVLHAYYSELVPALLNQLAVINVPFDLVVTNATGAPIELPVTAAQAVMVVDVENRGRDVWPFLQVIQAGLLDGYAAILKLHTKRSPQGVATSLGATTGEEWREQLVGSLVGSTESFHRAYAAVTSGNGGLACHDQSIAGPEDWDTNHRVVRHLARRIGVRAPASKLAFPAGSIFMMRGSLVPVLKKLRMSADDFQDEGDGSYTTTAHAVERLMGYVARSRGHDVIGLPSTTKE